MIDVGQVLRSSTDGFTCGTRSTNIVHPTFGAFVKSYSIQNLDDLIVIGLITSIRIDDDPLVRQLIMAGTLIQAAVRDQRENRMIPVEIDVVNVGYVGGGKIVHRLPPRPPLSLDPVELCDSDEVLAFTEDMSFMRLVLNARNVPDTIELLAAALHQAARIRPYEQQEEYLIEAGRQAVNFLNQDLGSLRHLLKLIRPA